MIVVLEERFAALFSFAYFSGLTGASLTGYTLL